ncbi:MAG TPA: hypothetical protein VNT79_15390 [Phycisphaerae bacterium]|nr:hypothetical protein [Phycisphaerae bacterium]
MINPDQFESVQRELTNCLQGRFPDLSVKIGNDIHYPGLNVVVTSHKFTGLLAEQRFHHVVRAIPKDLYEKHFQRGIVWFELAPGESGKDLMRMPRSTDLTTADESAIRKTLDEVRFFQKLAREFEGDDDEPSGVSFESTIRVLSKAGLPPDQVERCCLFMILKGAYCDAHVMRDLLPKFTADHAA